MALRERERKRKNKSRKEEGKRGALVGRTVRRQYALAFKSRRCDSVAGVALTLSGTDEDNPKTWWWSEGALTEEERERVRERESTIVDYTHAQAQCCSTCRDMRQSASQQFGTDERCDSNNALAHSMQAASSQH